MNEGLKIIYLQIGDHNYDDLDHEEITWCEDRQDDTDLEYIRAFPSPCTVEQYEAITGEKFPDDGMVWCLYPYDAGFFWKTHTFEESKRIIIRRYISVIVQTGQSAPPAYWRPE